MNRLYCGTIRKENIGEKIRLCGWVQRSRNKGALIFIELRDRSGIAQLLFNETSEKAIFETAESLGREWVLEVEGTVRQRESINDKIPTGDVELFVEKITVLSQAETPPFAVEEDSQVNDALKLKYRYLDLRSPDMQEVLKVRHKVTMLVREFFDENGFLEIETPMLTKSTPEGARDYLVPSRVHPGSFYALPQSPQQYKQLLMLSGVDRYFQIARCFRDEDLRADRQPEFTQIDVEMSFLSQEEILALQEGLLKFVFEGIKGITIPTPFPSMTWKEAMERFGSDKPDTRFGFELVDISDLVKDCEFKVFSGPIAEGGSVRLINIKNFAKDFPRKKVDKLVDVVKTYGGKGMAWARTVDGATTSSYQKFLTEEENQKICQRANFEENDLLLICGDGENKVVFDCLGALRVHIAKELNLLDDNQFNFLWVKEFPMFEFSKEENRYTAMHHPFTQPMEEDIDKLETDKVNCRAIAYDIVLNGNELGGGSLRIHKPEVQQAMFRGLGFSDEEALAQFGHLIEAFKYGAPPHGGIAYGLDRLVMLLTGKHSIRDVIAFPKVQNASELMTQSPDRVAEKQLEELGIALRPQEKE
ncbi:MAG: aspartate--tRNA ligase [Eubacteriales bacterium]